MAHLRDGWKRERLRAAVYDWGVETALVARVAGRALWGLDVDRLWTSIGELSQEPRGATVLDVPCGGGVAFRALSPTRPLRYVAADLSWVMLGRAGKRARKHRLDQIEFVQADVVALPFPDGSFDVCVTYNGLHCFPDPARALAEFARVLRPGGELRGTSVVRGAGRRYDATVALMQRAGVFGPTGTAEDFTRWLTDVGLTDVRVTGPGAVITLSARRPT
ncbi:MAG: rebM 1 [Actinomycetia bacterium]|nr:rebM 1 [Actinomycetes bacterium]